MADEDPYQQFDQDLQTLGFRLVQEGRRGVLQYVLAPTRYLTYSVHWDPAERSVLFTWEHAVAEYMSDQGMQIGANEEMNQFLFPKYDARGPQDVAFVVQEMERVERVLRSVNLAEGL